MHLTHFLRQSDEKVKTQFELFFSFNARAGTVFPMLETSSDYGVMQVSKFRSLDSIR